MGYDEQLGSGFTLLGLTSTPSGDRTAAAPAAPLTRRQARELENAGRPATSAPAVITPAPITIVTTPERKPVKVGRTIKRGKAVARPPRRRPGSSAPSKMLSLGAMLFAGALLVGMSVPANAFMTSAETMPGAPARLLAAETAETADLVKQLPGQSLAVSPDVASSTPVRDGYEVISYAQLLAQKYANISYAYQTTTGAVRWPFPYPVPITDGFGERVGGFHKGIDFVPGAGTPIYAIADGIVTEAREDQTTGYGNHVIINHTINGQKVESLYAHMISESRPVNVGDQIRVGDFLGLVGDTGIAYGAHLHFEIHLDGVPVDPFAWLQANAVN